MDGRHCSSAFMSSERLSLAGSEQRIEWFLSMLPSWLCQSSRLVSFLLPPGGCRRYTWRSSTTPAIHSHPQLSTARQLLTCSEHNHLPTVGTSCSRTSQTLHARILAHHHMLHKQTSFRQRKTPAAGEFQHPSSNKHSLSLYKCVVRTRHKDSHCPQRNCMDKYPPGRYHETLAGWLPP